MDTVPVPNTSQTTGVLETSIDPVVSAHDQKKRKRGKEKQENQVLSLSGWGEGGGGRGRQMKEKKKNGFLGTRSDARRITKTTFPGNRLKGGVGARLEAAASVNAGGHLKAY